jgi:hypothetical protein
MTEKQKKFKYLKKESSYVFRRKDKKFARIIIENLSYKRIKINKEFDKKLNNILMDLFLDNGEPITNGVNNGK